jgi:phospholipase C
VAGVWQQPAIPPGLPVTGTQYPWPLSNGAFAGAQPPNREQGAQNYGGTSHGWSDQHGAGLPGASHAIPGLTICAICALVSY